MQRHILQTRSSISLKFSTIELDSWAANALLLFLVFMEVSNSIPRLNDGRPDVSITFHQLILGMRVIVWTPYWFWTKEDFRFFI